MQKLETGKKILGQKMSMKNYCSKTEEDVLIGEKFCH